LKDSAQAPTLGKLGSSVARPSGLLARAERRRRSPAPPKLLGRGRGGHCPRRPRRRRGYVLPARAQWAPAAAGCAPCRARDRYTSKGPAQLFAGPAR
jgi:hypothetical protein